MNGKYVRIFFCVFFFLPLIFSCNRNATGKSFTSTLDEIDSLINQGQYADAKRELEKAEKMAFGSWAELGVFKRYTQIDEKTKAEKVLVRAIKKNPENQELNAVYTHFLLKNKRISEAISYGKKLQGTKFGSLYSQAVLQDTLDKSEKENLRSILLKEDYFPVYYDAWIGTKNPSWLINCALLHLALGNYERASSVLPQEVSSAKEAWFWSCVLYDSGKYADTVDLLQIAKKLYEFSYGKTDRIDRFVSYYMIHSLLADSYTNLGDADDSERIRREYLSEIQTEDGSWKLPENAKDSIFFPVLFTNSAKWAKDNFEDERAVELLYFCVDNWKDYVPALTFYADFAYNSNLERVEDFEQLKLRDYGLATLEMERYDRRAKIPLSDAKIRIKESLERTNDPLLYIVNLDLKYKTSNLTETEKTADLWNTLEKTQIAPGVNPELLTEYAVHYLLNKGQSLEAWKIFSKYISGTYGIKQDTKFWEETVRKIHEFSQKEAEFASYFAALGQKTTEAIRLHEYCVFETGSEITRDYVSHLCGSETCMNLAEIYNVRGLKNQALDLYAKINGRSSEIAIKSNAMYRMALIYADSGDKKNARRSAEYALSIDKSNADAKLLLAKLKM